MQWYHTTPEGQESAIDCIDWSYDTFYDAVTPRAAEAQLVVGRDCPVIEKQYVRAEEEGQTVFLGFVSRKPSLSGEQKGVECRGVEGQLQKRVCPKLTYSGGASISGTTLQHLFADKPPWIQPDTASTYEEPGLLNAANSLMPPGWIAPEFLTPIPAGLEQGVVHGPRWYTGGVIKFRFCGKKSRIGTSQIYHDWHIFEEYQTYEALIASTTAGIYRDDVDLWMRIPTGTLPGIYDTGFGYVYGNFFALNAFDTKVRRGIIDLATTLLTVPLTVGFGDTVMDILCNVAEFHKQHVRFRYENDGFCYMDVKANWDADGIVDIYESECDLIEYPADSDLQVDALIGLGAGEGQFQAAYSVFDTRPGKAFLVETETFENAMEDYSGNLAPLITLSWDERRAKQAIQVTNSNGDYDGIKPGQTVRLHVDGEPATLYQVFQVSRSAKSTVISIGNRTKDILDAKRADQAINSNYLVDDLLEIGSFSSSGIIGVGDWNHPDVAFTSEPIYLPAWADFVAYNPAVMLEISLSLREGHYIPADISSMLYACGSIDPTFADMEAHRIPNTETIQYMLGKSVTANIMGNVTWGVANYFRIHCILNGVWPAERRTRTDIIAGITTPAPAENRDNYYEGVWGRELNKNYYAYIVKLDDENYAWQIQPPGTVNQSATWQIGSQNDISVSLCESYVPASGRTSAQVLAEIVSHTPAQHRNDYMRGVWGQTLNVGYYMLLCKIFVDPTPTPANDLYAYQIQSTTLDPLASDNPWYIGTKTVAANALYNASQSGPRTQADIEADITHPTLGDFPAPADHEYTVHGFDVAANPKALIMQVSDAPNQYFAYQITSSTGGVGNWTVDVSGSGKDILAALLIDYTLDGLRTQTEILTDIQNLKFKDPLDKATGYAYKAYGYTQGATPYATVIQTNNLPQTFAYQLMPDDGDGEAKSWAINTDGGGGIADLLISPIKNYDCNVRVYIVRRRALP